MLWQTGQQTAHRDSRRGDDLSIELMINRGRARHRVRPVRPPVFLIGSAADCDLVLGDQRFADVHAYLLVGTGRVSLRWLGLEPELTVNGAPATHVRLEDDDRIRMGPYEFILRMTSTSDSPRDKARHLHPPHANFQGHAPAIDEALAELPLDPYAEEAGADSPWHSRATLRLYVEPSPPPAASLTAKFIRPGDVRPSLGTCPPYRAIMP